MLTNTTLTTGFTAIYTSSGTNVIPLIYLCNTSGSDVTVNVCAVPSGGVAGNSTKIYHNLLIPANDTFVIDSEKFVLANGDAIQASASTGSVVVATVSSMGV